MRRCALLLAFIAVAAPCAMAVPAAHEGSRAAATQPNAPAPLQVGRSRQVFVDRTFLAAASGVELRVHPPRKTGEATIRPEHAWEKGIGPYSCVLEIDGRYHMWYHAMSAENWNADALVGAICYARSTDGIHWEKPWLGITEYQGSRDNNIVLGFGAGGVNIWQEGMMVFVDPTAPADERFRLVMNLKHVAPGVHVFSSPDGLHWRLTHRSLITARPQAKGHHLDTQNVLFWDAARGRYVAYVRYNSNLPGSQGRSIARTESPWLGGFPVVQDMQVVLGPDAQDLMHGETNAVDYYSSGALRYPWAADAYYMFPVAYYHYLRGVHREFGDEVPTNAGPLHTQFAASRDGIHWERFDRRPFVDLGLRGEFDCYAARMIHGLVPATDGRHMYMYYLGSDWLHGWDRDDRNKRLLTGAGLAPPNNTTIISRLVLRRDGFVSVRGAYTGGEFITPPLTFEGDRLVVNVDTSATGTLRVELQDATGAAIPGYSLDECDLVHTANEINRVITWQGRSSLGDLSGKVIRIRFSIRDADLYAFQFMSD
ncbi:MAG TPA: hypothetical protein PL151_09390 [Phycisphaerae bacterium]|nr:hypothetical protein [Phycisphaerae bacterium]HOJ73100.1 hypothetical protein [Phycisphaerae bacterium]HOM52716.1 hypothetical protein [Phycisphaerae bacterium]HON67444.1 hypothetical protein [Phycisphaerae bacterium]HPP25462.1 hypothetical protein [Phycisphaerae bacterium]